MYISKGNHLVMKVADFKPSPTLAQFNLAKKLAMNDSSFFFKSDRLTLIPKYLNAIVEDQKDLKTKPAAK